MPCKYLALFLTHNNSQLTVKPLQTLWYHNTSSKLPYSIRYKKKSITNSECKVRGCNITSELLHQPQQPIFQHRMINCISVEVADQVKLFLFENEVAILQTVTCIQQIKHSLFLSDIWQHMPLILIFSHIEWRLHKKKHKPVWAVAVR